MSCEDCMYLSLGGMLEAADRNDRDEVLRVDGYYRAIETKRFKSGKYTLPVRGIVREYDLCAQSCIDAVNKHGADREKALADAKERYSRLENPWLG